VVCGLWFVVCGLWFVVCGLWFVVCGLCYRSKGLLQIFVFLLFIRHLSVGYMRLLSGFSIASLVSH
jgi:hypothetical protein